MDNLAKKVDVCPLSPLNWGHYVLFMYSWEREKCSLYGVAGVHYLGVSKV